MQGATLTKTLNLTQRRRDAVTLLPLLPVVLYLLLLFVYPVQLLWLSVIDSQGNLTAVHYVRLFTTEHLLRGLITFEIAFWTTLISVLAGYPLAYLIATVSSRVRNVLILWVLGRSGQAFWSAHLLGSYCWGCKGAINEWLAAIGMTDAPLPLIYNRAGVLIGMVHALMPIAVLDDGDRHAHYRSCTSRCSEHAWRAGGQSFWRVYLPLSMPGVAAGALLVFVLSLGFFITPALLGSGREVLIAQVIIEQIEQLLNWGFAGAVSVLFLFVTLAVIFLYEKSFAHRCRSKIQVRGIRRGRRALLRNGDL